MTDALPILLRRDLQTPPPPPRWPVGVSLVAFDPARHAHSVHTLLSEAYARGGGVIGSFGSWWASLRDDAEYDPLLVFVAVAAPEVVVGAAQCWTGAFVKDLAVAEAWRRQGIGKALLLHAFSVFRARDFRHVDLKVEADNCDAQRVYERSGMRPPS